MSETPVSEPEPLTPVSINSESSNVPDEENSDISPSSGVSSASSKSGIPKQSGIRPPSRIGRPCGGIQKPALPATPTKNSSDDSIRRLTDDFGRHRLTDLLEADESEEDNLDALKSPIRRKRFASIASTASSMDGLWELCPRRLSEAGLSRHSDSSAVLTEDTDSFIIGQRVWVGGTKPGTIAYIGETQFAPGEWAGIALDEPIGKNDGSVGGTRYFQCENKKGVFSRLTRLTRVPLEQPGMGSNETFISPNNGLRRSPISPTGSTKSLLRSPVSLSASNTSLTSSVAHVDFKIGDRVIIKSPQGSKVGTARYMGLTDFAPGEWVGVELDDPRGKNDGSVEGKRYFECRPNFGLFAPIAKVSKSPSKYKPAACAVHSGSGLPPSGMKRANSKESMNSMVSRTSAASSVRRVRLGVTSLTPQKVSSKTSATPLPTRTALQDVLKEKQQHIEQLLKERDLERAEITKAASQAEDAERRFYDLKQEFEEHLAQCRQEAIQKASLVSDLNSQQQEALEELKRKIEDLQFRYEEAAITKTDLEEENKNLQSKIKQLEESLAEDRQKIESLESTSNKLFEAEENLIKAREDVEALKKQLEEVANSKKESDEELVAKISAVDSLQKQIEAANLVNEQKENQIKLLNHEIQTIMSLDEEHKQNIVETAKKIEAISNEKDAEITKLQAELETEKKHNVSLMKEAEKLKIDISSRTLDLETTTEANAANEKQIKNVQEELDKVKKQLENTVVELNQQNQKSAEDIDNLKKQLEMSQADLKLKNSEIENIKNDFIVQIKNKEQQLEENKKVLAQTQDELQKLSKELTEVQALFEQTKGELLNQNSDSAKVMEDLRTALQKSETDLKLKITELEENNKALSGHISVKEQQLEEANKEIARSNEEIEKVKNELAEIQTIFEQSRQEINTKHAAEIASRDEKIQSVSADLQTKTEEIAKISAAIMRLEEEIGTKNAVIENLRIELSSYQQEKTSNTETSMALTQRLNEVTIQNGELQSQLSIANVKIEDLNNVKLKLETEMQGLVIKCENSVSKDEVKTELEAKDKDLAELQKKYEDKLQENCIEIQQVKSAIEAKEKQLEELRKENEDKLGINSSQLEQVQNELKAKVTELEELKKCYRNLEEKNLQLEQVKNEVQAKDSQLLDLEKKHEEKLQSMEKSAQETVSHLQTTISKFEQLKSELEEKLQSSVHSEEALKQRCDSLTADLERIQTQNSEQVSQLQQTLEAKEKELDKLLQNSDGFKQREEELKGVTEDLRKNLQDANEKTQVLCDEISQLKEQLAQKSEQLLAAQSESKDFLSQSQKAEKEIRDTLSQQIKSLELQIDEKNGLLEKSNQELELVKRNINSSSNELESREQTIKELTVKYNEAKDIETSLREQLNTAQVLQEQNSNENAEVLQRCKNLSQEIAVLTQQIQTSDERFKSLQTEHGNIMLLMQNIKITKQQKEQCLQNLQNIAIAENNNCNIVGLLNQLKVDETPDKTAEILNLHKDVEHLNAQLKQRNTQINNQTLELTRLQEELHKARESHRTGAEGDENSINFKCTDCQQLLQDREMSENQIKFLNSIIVDMQKKNEEQRARIEILEAGELPVNDLDLNFGARRLAPRMYCDICEEFDLHETEDCPKQTNEDAPNVKQHELRKIPAERPYCELCEVFGHATEDCQEDQTF